MATQTCTGTQFSSSNFLCCAGRFTGMQQDSQVCNRRLRQRPRCSWTTSNQQADLQADGKSDWCQRQGQKAQQAGHWQTGSSLPDRFDHRCPADPGRHPAHSSSSSFVPQLINNVILPCRCASTSIAQIRGASSCCSAASSRFRDPLLGCRTHLTSMLSNGYLVTQPCLHLKS